MKPLPVVEPDSSRPRPADGPAYHRCHEHANRPSTEVRRQPERARYDRATIDSILDEAFFCHLGFIHEGHPVVIPTIHVRVGDRIILHGSPASRMMRALKAGAEVSIAVTLLDGLVLARSVFHHSMNYRSVVLFGSGEVIEDPAEKLEAMRVFTEKILPGRWDDARQPTDKEFKGTLMVAVPIDAASAKTRTGPPGDDPDDMDLRHLGRRHPLPTRSRRARSRPRTCQPGVPSPTTWRISWTEPGSRPPSRRNRGPIRCCRVLVAAPALPPMGGGRVSLVIGAAVWDLRSEPTTLHPFLAGSRADGRIDRGSDLEWREVPSGMVSVPDLTRPDRSRRSPGRGSPCWTRCSGDRRRPGRIGGASRWPSGRTPDRATGAARGGRPTDDRGRESW